MACPAYQSISKQKAREAVERAYVLHRGDDSGKNADYIPFLSNVDPSLFGISMCFCDGTRIDVGDTDHAFGIESVSKVHTAILAMRQQGTKAVLERIGADATGLAFDSMLALVLENARPSTPLVNAGAIAACSMIEPIGNREAKWQAIEANMEELSGGPLTLLDELYRSESETNFTNRSIAWMLKRYGRIYDEPGLALDLYTRQCSLGVTTTQLATCAATIANRGLNPVTGAQAFDPEIAAEVTCLITGAGFYQHTGEWLFRSGIPAKSGVGGGIMGVMPGLFGIAAFAPPLDEAGNSVRAQNAICTIMKELDLNVFDSRHLTLVTD